MSSGIQYNAVNRCFAVITAIAAFVSFCLQIHYASLLSVNNQAKTFMALFCIFSILLLLVQFISSCPKSFPVIFSLSTFCFITVWRLAVASKLPVVPYIYLVGFIFIVLNFLYLGYLNLKSGIGTPYEWQLTFIRLYVGYNAIPHFTDKLFSGDAIRDGYVGFFTHVGISAPLTMVVIAGLIEFVGALFISTGFLTRLSAICFFIYLVIAPSLSGELSSGFMQGWQYPVLWSVLVLSFAFFGSRLFSVDGALGRSYPLPQWIRSLMGRDKSY